MTPGSYFGISTINGASVGSPAAYILGGKLFITGIAEGIPLKDITSYSRTAYSAGTASAWTVTPGTVADLTEYSITVTRLLGKAVNGLTTPPTPVNKKTYIIFSGVGDTATNLGDKFRTAILADANAFVVGSGTTTLILTGADKLSDFAVDITNFPSTKNNGTAYVAPAGIQTMVAVYDAINATAAQHATYQIEWNRRESSYVTTKQSVLVFVDSNTSSTLFTAFDTKLVSILTSLSGRPGFAPTLLTANATYAATIADNFIVYNYAGANTINLPDSTAYGDGMLIIVNASNSTVTVGKTTGGDTLNGTSATTILTVVAGIYMNCAAITTWTRISIS